MEVIAIFPDKVAETLAIQALKDELEAVFGVDVNIFNKNDPTLIVEEYMDSYQRYYDYFFEILTNAHIEDSKVIIGDEVGYIMWSVQDFKDVAINMFNEISEATLEDIERWNIKVIIFIR